MTDKPTSTGFNGLKAQKSDHLLDLERAKAAKKAAAQCPSNTQPNQTPPRQHTPGKTILRQPAHTLPTTGASSIGWWLLGGFAVVMFVIWVADSPERASTLNSVTQVSTEEQAAANAADAATAAGSAFQPIEAHVITVRANVRNQPSTRGAIVAELSQMQSLSVIGKEGSWSQVAIGSGVNTAQGYVSSKLLFEGTAQGAKAVVCEVASSSIPYSGEVLSRSGTGHNSLAVNAGGSDVLIKLRQGGSTALSFYVRNGERGVVPDIPDGTYQVMFATGDGFSRKCLEFVNSMSVSSDPNPATFETNITSDGYNRYTQNTAAEYTLTRQVGGNFTPSTVDESAFRE